MTSPMLFAAVLLGGQLAAAADFTPVGDLVLEGAGRPLRIRLTVAVEGRSVVEGHRLACEEHESALMALLDADGNGVLSPAEAAHLPPPRFTATPPGEQGEIAFAFNFRVLDDDDSGGVSREELSAFYSAYGVPPVERHAARRTASAAPNLFSLLDADGDGELIKGEVENAALTWRRIRTGAVAPATQEPAPATRENSDEFVATSGRPGQSALRASLAAPSAVEPAATLRIDYTASAGPRIDFIPSERDGDAGKIRHSVLDDGAVRLSCGTRTVVIVRLLPPPMRRDLETKGALLRELAAADDDGDGIVSASDRLPPALAGRFALLDANGDGDVSAAEIEKYAGALLPFQSRAETTRIGLLFHEAGDGLFHFADTNEDGRLTAAEAARLSRCFAALDAATDGRLTPDDIPQVTRIDLYRGSIPPLYGDTDLASVGPPWHYRMDRDRDGWISPAEFLGPLEAFQSIDADADGFVSLAESLAADGLKVKEQSE